MNPLIKRATSLPGSQTTSQSIRFFLMHLTTEPGVYLMKDTLGVVIYVGKACNLKKRVSSYFKQKHRSSKTEVLVQQIASIDIQVTRSEKEALLLENTLIKKWMPKYNVLMRDDKTYPFLHLSKKHTYPRLSIVRLKKRPSLGEYFGPFPSVAAVREALKILQKIFLLRQCSDREFSQRTRPCLQYQIQRCSAPCVGYISLESYQTVVKDVTRFLSGKTSEVLDNMAKRMSALSQQLAFEEAAIVRDQIKQLRLLQEQQSIVLGSRDCDVIALQVQSGFGCILCVSYRDGAVVSQESFFPAIPALDWYENADALLLEVFDAFIHYYYLAMPIRIPQKIITHHVIPQKLLLQSLLSDVSEHACVIIDHPKLSHARLMDFALNNLQQTIYAHEHSAGEINKRYEALKNRLLLSDIKRMECYDISHTQGHETVASCVVFNENGPLKRDYRRYLISDITGGDDYAAMAQVLSRRLQNKKMPLPDVMIIDGGKGQVNRVKAILDHYDIQSIFLLGIAKGPERKPGMEHIIRSDTGEEEQWPANDLALHLLQHIRDEAHRFAITLHRSRRQKQAMSSSLNSIEGIGSKRRMSLLKRFGGIQELAKASIEEISKVHGISRALAGKIYAHFHQ